ncbi:MAG: hypothetical protein ABRQ39_26070 [Candidatus Eremiobacterota bacterium]
MPTVMQGDINHNEEIYFQDKNITITSKKISVNKRTYIFYPVTVEMPLSNICSCEVKTFYKGDPCRPARHYEFSLVIFLRKEMKWEKLLSGKDRNYLDMVQAILTDALGNRYNRGN